MIFYTICFAFFHDYHNDHGARKMKTVDDDNEAQLRVGYACACAPRWMRPVGGLPTLASPIGDDDRVQLSALKNRQLGPE